MEEIREIKITIYVRTNKTTYEKTFEDIQDVDDAFEYFWDIMDELD